MYAGRKRKRDITVKREKKQRYRSPGRLSTRSAGRWRRRWSAKGRNFGRGALTAQHPMASLFTSPKVRKSQAVYKFTALNMVDSSSNTLVDPASGTIVFHVSGSNMYDPLMSNASINGEVRNNLVPDDVYRPAAGHDTYAEFLEQYCCVGSRMTVRMADHVESPGTGSGGADYNLDWGICSSSDPPQYEVGLADFAHACTAGLQTATVTADSGQVSLSQVISPSKAFGVKDCKQNGKDFDAKFGELAIPHSGHFAEQKPENAVYHTIVIDPIQTGSDTAQNFDMIVEIEYLFYPRGTKLGEADAPVNPNP